jgi:hypothetical protein
MQARVLRPHQLAPFEAADLLMHAFGAVADRTRSGLGRDALHAMN